MQQPLVTEESAIKRKPDKNIYKQRIPSINIQFNNYIQINIIY